MATRMVVVVEVGADDWTPTTPEMTSLARDLKRAVQNDAGGVVFTRPGMHVRSYEFDENSIFVVNGKVVQLDDDEPSDDEPYKEGEY